MPAPTGSRPETDQTNAPSVAANVEETAPAARTGGFGLPAAVGEVGTLGPYRVLKELGRGGMGAVYAALDTRLDRRVALKVMLPEFAADGLARERFLREARAVARVKHDNVVTVYEADERNGVAYIAMEFLEGFPLDMFLKRKGPPTLPQSLRVAREAAAGLAAAHKLGLVHRDIKPANLWLEAPGGRVKVLDFGLVKPVGAADELTKSGAVIGTPAYMSPEQARGEKIDHRTDLFSLGAVLYRLCTGALPFNGPSAMAVLLALGTEEPPAVSELNPEVPEPLAALVHQLLSKRAEDRPQTADEVVKRLRAVAEERSAARSRPIELSTSQPQLVRPRAAHVPIRVAAPTGQNPSAERDAPSEELTEQESAELAPERGRKEPRGFGPLLTAACGLLALSAIAAAGVIIVIKNKDGTETKIDVPDSAALAVKDNGDKARAQVGPEKARPAVAHEFAAGAGGAIAKEKTRTETKPAVAGDPDRAAAEYATSVGGVVKVSGQGHEIRAAADLPKGWFTLVWVHLNGTQVTDADLAHFKDCEGLTSLSLSNTGVTDAGLAHFRGCEGLTSLSLNGTQITDAGLAHFKDCKRLTYLSLSGTGVTVKELKALGATLPGCRIVYDGGSIEPKK